MNNDQKTTVLGTLFAGLQAANLDWAKLTHGDSQEISKAISAALFVAFSWYTNKHQ